MTVPGLCDSLLRWGSKAHFTDFKNAMRLSVLKPVPEWGSLNWERRIGLNFWLLRSSAEKMRLAHVWLDSVKLRFLSSSFAYFIRTVAVFVLLYLN